jgi:hypothetical protein
MTTLTSPPLAVRATSPLSFAPPLAPADFAALRRRLLLDHCKWDPQVGDHSALASFPLVITRATWQTLARDAESLAAETTRAE